MEAPLNVQPLLLIAALIRLILGVLAMSASAAGDKAGHATSPPQGVYWAVLVWAVVPICCVVWCLGAFDGDLSRVPWLVAGLLVLFPWWATRRVFIPLGMWRTAYAVTRLSAYWWRGDTEGGATMAAAWALLHGRGRPNAAAVTWILARRDAQQPLRGGGLLATALIADLRDDREGMLALTRSVLHLAPDPRHFGARAIATQWLAADAASRGDWPAVEALTQAVRPLNAEARLLGFIARGQRHGVRGALAKGRLMAAWLLAPHRWQTWAVVAQTMRTGGANGPGERDEAPPQADAEPDEADAGPAGESGWPLGAVAAHARLMTAADGSLPSEQLAELAAVWEKALSSEALRTFVGKRAMATGARRVDALAVTRAQVVDDLAQLLRRRKTSVGQDPPLLLAEASLRVESTASAEVEACWAPIERRRKEGAELCATDEWREFVALQTAYAAAIALRGDAGRRLLFDETDTVVSHLAARLWNDRQERSLANAMFNWLLPEAEAVQDEEAINRLRRNVRGGL